LLIAEQRAVGFIPAWSLATLQSERNERGDLRYLNVITVRYWERNFVLTFLVPVEVGCYYLLQRSVVVSSQELVLASFIDSRDEFPSNIANIQELRESIDISIY